MIPPKSRTAMRDEAAEKRWEMKPLRELFDEKIEREAEKFMKELIGDCEWCDLNKDSFIRGANSIKGMILDLVEALKFYSTHPEKKVKGQIQWNPHVCDTFSGLMYAPDWDGDLQDEPNEIAEKALHKLRKELGDEKT